MSIQPLETGLTGARKLKKKSVTTVTTMFLVLKVFHTLVLPQNGTASAGSILLGRQLLMRLRPTFIKTI